MWLWIDSIWGCGFGGGFVVWLSWGLDSDDVICWGFVFVWEDSDVVGE